MGASSAKEGGPEGTPPGVNVSGEEGASGVEDEWDSDNRRAILLAGADEGVFDVEEGAYGAEESILVWKRAPLARLCSTRESWVKFDWTLTQMSRVRVEWAIKIKDMSRVRVESRWSSFESELSSQLDTAWVKGEALIFWRETLKFCIYL